MTTRVLSPNSSDRKLRNAALYLAVVTALIAVLTAPAAAQRYVGGKPSPSVTVDYSVLDELGRAPNIPQLFLQNSPRASFGASTYRTQPQFPVISGSSDKV